MPRIDALLQHLAAKKGSDLHLTSGVQPRIRVHGSLEAVPGWPELDDESIGVILHEIAPAPAWDRFVQSNDVDFGYEVTGLARYRVNFFRQENGRGAVLRTIPERVVSIEELKMPPAVEAFAHLREGLVLVTGPTGSGKSTTLAAIVDRINRSYARHIVTIEDPIEFVHQNKKSIISHREVGRHTKGFAPALRAAVRQDADVLLVGEMRDYDTISLALTAAEMGLLVFGTLHTNSAAKTIDRLIDAFPANEQPQARLSLSESLAGVCSQLLLRTTDGKGRIAATEILVRSPALANLIRENNTSMIYSMIQAGRGQGMQTMDQSLLTLFEGKSITADDAYHRASDKSMFEHFPRSQPGMATRAAPTAAALAPGLSLATGPGGAKIVVAKKPG